MCLALIHASQSESPLTTATAPPPTSMKLWENICAPDLGKSNGAKQKLVKQNVGSFPKERQRLSVLLLTYFHYLFHKSILTFICTHMSWFIVLMGWILQRTDFVVKTTDRASGLAGWGWETNDIQQRFSASGSWAKNGWQVCSDGVVDNLKSNVRCK